MSTFLDISDKVAGGCEPGLLDLAFPHNYKQAGFFYVQYNAKDFSLTTARYSANPTTKTADSSSGKVVLSVPHPNECNHNGGWIGFGPKDGYLYVSTGDGGNQGDPNGHAQDKTSLLGKILRIDVGSNGENVPAKVPSGNPFGNQVWAYGFRNPWRASFDRSTGDLLIGDVGQDRVEEVNFAANGGKGNNFGWRTTEGNECFNASNPPSSFNNPLSSCDKTGIIPPVYSYPHNGTSAAVTGGYVYRGKKYPRMTGIYFFTDSSQPNLWSLRKNGSSWSFKTEISSVGGTLVSFGEDENGEVYLVSIEGTVYQLTDTGN